MFYLPPFLIKPSRPPEPSKYAVIRLFTSLQCDPGLNPEHGVISELCQWLVPVLAPRDFSDFFPSKNEHF